MRRSERSNKLSFAEDATLSPRLFDLLDTVFPGVRQVAENARSLGAPWEAASTPFIRFEEGRVVSHVGVIELSLVLMGHRIKVGSVHGVATHPLYRRRGYFRQLMEAALEHCTDRYEVQILTTEHPEYFEPFGFRAVQEHLFTVKCDSPGGIDGFRLINPQDPTDVALLHRLLETREPISNVVGVVDEKAVFCVNEGSRPLYYSNDLDVVVCLESEGKRIKLFDVVGPRVPELSALLSKMPEPIEEVAICFSPERLTAQAVASPWLFEHDGPSYLMARGAFPAEDHPFALPRSART